MSSDPLGIAADVDGVAASEAAVDIDIGINIDVEGDVAPASELGEDELHPARMPTDRPSETAHKPAKRNSRRRVSRELTLGAT
jgi:hypothetical protein